MCISSYVHTYTLFTNKSNRYETRVPRSLHLLDCMCLFDVYVRTFFSGEKVLRGSE